MLKSFTACNPALADKTRACPSCVVPSGPVLSAASCLFLNRGGLSDSQDQPALGSCSKGLAHVCQCACWHTRHTF